MRLAVLPLLLASCLAPTVHETIDLTELFEAHDAKGALVVVDRRSNSSWRHDPGRCAEPFHPASTFEMFLFMAALETGAVAGPEDVIPWDGVDRGSASWNRDHDAKSALQASAVWFYQEIARRIGRETMQRLLRREKYGNMQTGEPLDAFWLDGDLAISPDEQVEFLLRVFRAESGFEGSVRYTLFYALPGGPNWYRGEDGEHGWLVGYAGHRLHDCAFALLVEPAGPDFHMRSARDGIARAALADLGFLRRAD